MAFSCGNQMLVSLLVIFCAVIINGELLTYKKNKVKVCDDDGYNNCTKHNLKTYQRNGCLQKMGQMEETGLEYVENTYAIYPPTTTAEPSGCCETLQLLTWYNLLTSSHGEECYIIQMPKFGLYQFTEIGLCGTTKCYSDHECIQQYTYVSLLAYCPKRGFCFYWFKVPAYCECGDNNY